MDDVSPDEVGGKGLFNGDNREIKPGMEEVWF